ncbi:MAG: hypothetical protein J5I94_21935 [Phaeodactylibacter sp.]|nr:hypothetical protein [Phaeodactylibacter sp.]
MKLHSRVLFFHTQKSVNQFFACEKIVKLNAAIQVIVLHKPVMIIDICIVNGDKQQLAVPSKEEEKKKRLTTNKRRRSWRQLLRKVEKRSNPTNAYIL